MEFIKLHGQRVVGLRNDGQVVSVRGLESDNRVTAIENTSKNGLITLLDSRLTGTRGAATLPAVINSGAMFVRDVNTTGYAVGVKNIAEQGTRQDAPSGDVREWVSHAPYAAQSGSRKSSLRLPVKETPIAPQDALDQWVSPAEFGGSPDDDLDDTEAVQKAIDSGRTTLYFPVSTNKKMWRIDGTVLVRGAIHRITSLECRLAGTGVFRVVDGAAPQVVLDRIDLYQGGLSLEQASSRPVTFSGMIFGSGKIIDNGAGDLFIEDVCVGQFVINKSNVWMRQYNPESKERKILNDGGTLGVLGLKTEQAGTICETVDGGRTEILGGFIYSQGAEKTTPMFVVKDAQMTATVGETTWNKRNFRTILEETADSNSNCNGESNKVGRRVVRCSKASPFRTPTRRDPPWPTLISTRSTANTSAIFDEACCPWPGPPGSSASTPPPSRASCGETPIPKAATRRSTPMPKPESDGANPAAASSTTTKNSASTCSSG